MSPQPAPPDDPITLALSFEDNRAVQVLFGPDNANLTRLESRLGVAVVSRGNGVAISGPRPGAEAAGEALERLYGEAVRGREVAAAEVDAAVRHSAVADPAQRLDPAALEALTIHTYKRPIAPRSPTQGTYVKAMQDHELVFGLGPAGTGKTFLAVAMAVGMLRQGRVERLILSRPAVEAGEKIGFLPGDMRDKVDPYLRPLYDALHVCLPGDKVARALESGDIEVAPLAFMRGRTLSNAFVILDEAQNTTPTQMKMFLTRLGENSRMVVTGDLSQVDLPLGARSGLKDALGVLEGLDGMAAVRFTARDVVRHDLVTRIVRAYDQHEGALAVTPGPQQGDAEP
ncbi:PhoH family protein [Roseospirillum parvum]|uniref:PhoH-like protein n=1 Tax=Roseospirillum parvum TaxID=83401 RepID=A0A1G8DM73_9PROT|nr:PhoH family protein [Roseospirillum parvum]SDH58794.1 phosphate starvation-inducible protein PhoH [Roseospirillum parvum]